MRFLTTFLLATTFAFAARAEGAPDARTVLLDALVLTPALERTNARLGIEQAVMMSLRERGWEAVSVATDCKDLGCAAAVATSAKALYVLILSGRFVPEETYAADVGVSLWRDGTVIASRTEADEEADAERTSGSLNSVLRCGPPSGACTTKLLTTKLEQYAAKLVEDESAATRAKALVAKAAASPSPAQQVPPVSLTPVASQDEPRAGTGRTAGWSLVIGGALALAGGGVLWALNDAGSDCHGVPGDSDGCRRVLRTHDAAIVTEVAGILGLAGGVVLLVLDHGLSRVALSMQPNGLTLKSTFH